MQTNGKKELWSVHGWSFLHRDRTAPQWCSFHGRKSFTNFSKVCPFHRLQFLINCSSMSPFPWDNAFLEQTAPVGVPCVATSPAAMLFTAVYGRISALSPGAPSTLPSLISVPSELFLSHIVTHLILSHLILWL